MELPFVGVLCAELLVVLVLILVLKSWFWLGARSSREKLFGKIE